MRRMQQNTEFPDWDNLHRTTQKTNRYLWLRDGALRESTDKSLDGKIKGPTLILGQLARRVPSFSELPADQAVYACLRDTRDMHFLGLNAKLLTQPELESL